SKKIPSSNPRVSLGSFCMEFACSPCACVGFLRVLWLPPILPHPPTLVRIKRFCLMTNSTPKFNELIEVQQPTVTSSTWPSSTSPSTVVVAVDHTKLWAMIRSAAGAQRTGFKRKAEDQTHSKRAAGFSPSLQSSASPPHSSSKSQSSHVDLETESLLNQQSTKEQKSKKVREKIIMTN
uniref:Uncharacterized protein n=1 Tax=Acanthochromis polyacanthus TaxID=80966 RepID=A0A3Q1GQV5_9TELE